MTILDTSVWVAYLNQNDSLHKKAAKLFDSFSPQIVIGVPEYVLLEVCTILMIRASKATADNFLEYSLDNKNIEILHANPDLLSATIESFREQSSGKLSFVDSALLALSRDHRIITFDQHLHRALQ